MAAWRSEQGTISAFVAVLAIALIVTAGLAYDGGAIITATANAHDIAAGAARAGAQHLDPAAVHAGQPRLDPAAAIAAVDAVVDAAGMDAQTTIEGPTVTVTVTTRQPMRLLPLPDRPIAATVSSTAVSDVLGDPP